LYRWGPVVKRCGFDSEKREEELPLIHPMILSSTTIYIFFFFLK